MALKGLQKETFAAVFTFGEYGAVSDLRSISIAGKTIQQFVVTADTNKSVQ